MMVQPDNRKRYPFDRSSIYRICVQGFLHESWSERLGGLRITTGNLKGRAVTELTGQICDQAELAGVLSALYERHLTILLVEYQGDGYPMQEVKQ
jgi:hypothetical protein